MADMCRVYLSFMPKWLIWTLGTVLTLHNVAHILYSITVYREAPIPLWVGVISQICVSFLLIFLLLFQSVLWCRGVRDRTLVITCSPIVSFAFVHCIHSVNMYTQNLEPCKYLLRTLIASLRLTPVLNAMHLLSYY